MRKSRPVDVEKQLSRLERKHEVLKRRVSEMDHLTFLTSTDAVRRAELKKKKLATKDALEELRRTLHAS